MVKGDNMKINENLVELEEVLLNLNDVEKNKIPNEVFEYIKENKDNDYKFKYDCSKNLDEQNLERTTIIMLSYLNMKYLLNDEQRKLMEEIHELNQKKVDQINNKFQRDLDDIFKQKERVLNDKKCLPKENALVVTKKVSWFEKLLKFFRLK